MNASRLAALAFVLGGALLFAFEATVPRVAGLVLLFTAMALGVFAIASPGFLERDKPR